MPGDRGENYFLLFVLCVVLFMFVGVVFNVTFFAEQKKKEFANKF